jgi:hypothetical protein
MVVYASLLLCAMFALGPHVFAQGSDARDITSKPEYRGYRVRGEGGGSGGSGGSGGGGSGGSGNSGTGQPGEDGEWQPSDSSPPEEAGRDDWEEPKPEPGEWQPSQPDDAWGKSSGDGFKRGSTATGPSRPAPEPRGRSSGWDGGGGGGSGAFGEFLAVVFKVVMWVVLIGGGLVALYFIIRALMGIRFGKRARKSKASKKKAAAKPADAGGQPDAPAQPELPPEFEDALAVARKELADALAQGDYARATVLRYRVFWLEAGWRGCVEQTDVRTWRDALRMARKEARGALRPSLSLVERVRYGDYKPAAHEFEEWQSTLQQVEPRGVIA